MNGDDLRWKARHVKGASKSQLVRFILAGIGTDAERWCAVWELRCRWYRDNRLDRLYNAGWKAARVEVANA